MKINLAALCLINLSLLLYPFAPPCKAENIYLKTGGVLKGKINSRDKKSISLSVATQESPVALKVTDVDRIEDDSGGLSKYDYRSLINKSQEYLLHNEYAKAAELYATLAQSFPQNADIHYLCGALNQKTGNLDKALEHYNYLVARNAADSGIFNNIAVIYAENKQYQEAILWLKKALQANPDLPDARENLANLSLKAKDFDTAIAEYRKILELRPEDLAIAYSLGLAYAAKNDFVKAKEQWKKILATNPSGPETKKSLELLRTLMDKF